MSQFTPVNQKRLTNVSVVRLKKGGNRYELACYPNKVKAWREKLETHLDEVLQANCVFSNVSKGQFANRKEMFQVFKTEDEEKIIRLILEQGELQSTEKERSIEQASVFKDVAKLISERCINPENNRAYTVTMIEKMMKDCHVSLKSNKTAKQHALEVMKHLCSVSDYKISQIMTEVTISVDQDIVEDVAEKISPLSVDLVRKGRLGTNNYGLVVLIQTENIGSIETLLSSHYKGNYSIEISGDKNKQNVLQTTSDCKDEKDPNIIIAKSQKPAAGEQTEKPSQLEKKGKKKQRAKKKHHHDDDSWSDN